MRHAALLALLVSLAVPAWAQTRPGQPRRARSPGDAADARRRQAGRRGLRKHAGNHRLRAAGAGRVQAGDQKTEAWIFFDNDNIYVSARNWESHPERRVANEMRRERANCGRTTRLPCVRYLPRQAQRLHLLRQRNRRDVRQPGHRRGAAQHRLEHRVDVRASNFEGGWTIEMSIPFKSLRYQPGVDQVWGINLRRVVRWKNEWSYLAQVPRAQTTFRGILKVSSAGTLESAANGQCGISS